MKVWELSSITRGHPGLLVRVAATRPEWSRYGLIFEDENLHTLVCTQDRDVLDGQVDHDFALAVLQQVPQKLYLSSHQ